MKRVRYYLPGLALILSGVFIIAFPEILVALIASIVIMAGIGALIFGKRLEDSEQEFEDRFPDGLNDDYFENYRTGKKPFFRYYRRWF